MGDENNGEGGMGGAVIFFLIFVVGNFVLYKTTGILIIPIRR